MVKLFRIILTTVFLLSMSGLLNCADAASKLPAHIVIFFSTDTHNELFMCGCQGERIGGVARRKTVISKMTEYPKVVVDVGGFAGGSTRLEKLRTETLLKSYNNIGFSAINLGNTEYRLGLDIIKQYDKIADAPFISSNIADASDKLIFPPYTISTVSGLRIGFIGVTTSEFIKNEVHKGLKILDIRQQVKKYIPELSKKCDLIILLADARDNEIEKLAVDNPQIAVILGGLTFNYSENDRPTKLSKTIIHKNGGRGRYLGRLRLDLDKSSHPKIKSYEGFNQKLGPDIPDEPSVVKILDEYKKILKTTDFTQEEGAQKEIPPETKTKDTGKTQKSSDAPERETPAYMSYASALRCMECHKAIYDDWKSTAHSKAFQTLIREKQDKNPECLDCHTVGFNRMGGFIDEKNTPQLSSVQCESCHGAAAAHVLAMMKDKKSTKKAITARVPEFFCTKCHNEQWDPEFNMKKKLHLVNHSSVKTKAK